MIISDTLSIRAHAYARTLLSCQPWQQGNKLLSLASCRRSAAFYSPSSAATQERKCPKIAVAAADTRAAGLGRVWPECAVDAEEEEKKKNIEVSYRNGCLIEMQLAHFSGCMLYYQTKPLRVYSKDANKKPALVCSIPSVDTLLHQMQRFPRRLSSSGAHFQSPLTVSDNSAGKESIFIASCCLINSSLLCKMQPSSASVNSCAHLSCDSAKII